jgi:hypothetical protein
VEDEKSVSWALYSYPLLKPSDLTTVLIVLQDMVPAISNKRGAKILIYCALALPTTDKYQMFLQHTMEDKKSVSWPFKAIIIISFNQKV